MFERVYLIVDLFAIAACLGAFGLLLRHRSVIRRLRLGGVHLMYLAGLGVVIMLILIAIWALRHHQLDLFLAAQSMLMLLICGGLFGGVWVLTNALQQLTLQLDKRVDAESSLKKHQDHLQQLIQQRTDALRREIASRSALQQSISEYARTMERDLTFAARTQTALQSPLPELDFVKLAAQSFARDQVNGDLYHTVLAGDGSLLVLVGDAMGHGAAAGFMTIMVRTALKNISDESPPFVLLEKLNAILRQQDAGIFVTAVLARIYPDGLCMLSHAGHPPSYYLPAGADEPKELNEGGFALGMFGQESAYYDQDELRLAPGDRLLLYSDGVTEASSPDGEEFGVERLRAAWVRHAQRPIGDSLLATLEDVYDFSAGSEITDDVTVFGLEYTGRGGA